MLESRYQNQKGLLNCGILHVLSVTIPGIFPPVSSENVALFLCICPYHLSQPVTLNLIVNFYHIWQRNGNLFCHFGKTLLNGGEGTKFFFQLKKIQQFKLNSHLFCWPSISQALHAYFGLSYRTNHLLLSQWLTWKGPDRLQM